MNPINTNIPLFKPACIGKEHELVQEVLQDWENKGQKIQAECENFLIKKYSFNNFHLSISFRSAIDQVFSIINSGSRGDIILPSFCDPLFEKIALQHHLTPRFADIDPLTLTIRPDEIKRLLNVNTVAVLVSHYSGTGADMYEIDSLCKKEKITLIEDCSMALESFYNNKPLGTFGHAAIFSFEEHNSISAGSGGGIVLNDPILQSRFKKGDSEKMPAANAAILMSRLEQLNKILHKKTFLWEKYYNELLFLEHRLVIRLPYSPDECTINGELFYFICNSSSEREALLRLLDHKNIEADKHFPFADTDHKGVLRNSKEASDKILRLPIHYELTAAQQEYILQAIMDFYS